MALCKLMVLANGRKFVWQKIEGSTPQEARKSAESKMRYWKSRVSSLFGKNADLWLETDAGLPILRLVGKIRNVPGLPPRLANKRLFLSILQSIEKTGSTVRKSSILDRLYGFGDRNLQLRSLRSDCQFYGIEFCEIKCDERKSDELPEVKIRFSARKSGEVRHSIEMFVTNYPHLNRAA